MPTNWVVGINLVVDILVIVTVPIYVLFLRHLIINKKNADSVKGNGFALIMFANGFWDLLNSLTSLIFVEIPNYGIWKEFYETDDLWKARITKAFTLGSQIFQMISASAIAVNRWYAINRPIAYNTVFSPRNMRLLYIIFYILTILYMCPILFIVKAKAYSYDDGTMYYGFNDVIYVLAYGLIYVAFSCVTVIIWVVVYSQISVYIANNLQKAFRKNQVKRTVAKVTAASFMFTVGTIFTFAITISNDVAWRFFGVANLYSVDAYYCLTRVGQELANLSTPWIMMAFFPEMREGIMKQLMCCVNGRNKVFQLSMKTGTNSVVRSSTGPSVSVVPMRNIAIAGLGNQGRDQLRTNMAFVNSTTTTKIV